MPIDWPFVDDIIRLGGFGEHKIAVQDGARQQETARSVLSDLTTQPGVILADEVGMGKTYVALAVVTSVVCATRSSGRPVVVMTPPGLVSKWQREWAQFKALCCDPDSLAWVRDAYVQTPTDLFKRLDDPRGRRPHIVWMSTSCFNHGLSDGWTKLALIRLARSQTRMDEETKKKISKWATRLVRLRRKRELTPELVERLLVSHLSDWLRILVREGILSQEDDDPVPQHLLQHSHKIDLSPIVSVLRGESIPGRRGAVSQERLQEARWNFNEACQQVYWNWLSLVRWRAPLLVLDEAHHAKNDGTRLARLLRSEDTSRLIEVGSGVVRPLLWEKFDRMLFLTATPFQLGHQELIRVLRSFAAAKWAGPTSPSGTREEFLAAMDELERRLSENLLAGRRLDRLWGRLAHNAISRHASNGDVADAAVAWWREISVEGTDDLVSRELLTAIDDCRRTKAIAESDSEKPWCSLRPWVIRHNRSIQLPIESSGHVVPRRVVAPGRAISDYDGRSKAENLLSATTPGLPIGGEGALPFLLAARAQGELARGSARGRAFFAEGLCSSYEAFHHTRENRGDARDVDDEGVELSGKRSRVARAQGVVPVAWYEDQIERIIPSKVAPENERYRHPKMQAVVNRAINLWRAGEKVLIFCFYRETAKALREHIGREVENATRALVAEKLGLDSSRHAQYLDTWFDRVARRLADEDSPFHQAVVTALREPLNTDNFAILRPRADHLVQLMAAYLRSPSFIARYFPLEIPAVREALAEGAARPPVVREGADALVRSLADRTDASALSMLRRMEEFLRFAKELAEQSMYRPLSDDAASDPVGEYLRAIAVQIGGADDEEDREADGATFRVQQPVRMVYGDTKRETRERLMLAFNSPMFPEILISSAVLGEGVDLHRFCRYVIHHDLCWNPSTLEQRTGRLDRIRCKAEIAHLPIVVYEPFIGGSADEKMFRVVMDRERWFQIVMGQKFQFDEATTEEFASRVPLPEELAAELVFDLRRFRDFLTPAVSSAPVNLTNGLTQ
jgi:hypothetical protein